MDFLNSKNVWSQRPMFVTAHSCLYLVQSLLGCENKTLCPVIHLLCPISNFWALAKRSISFWKLNQSYYLKKKSWGFFVFRCLMRIVGFFSKQYYYNTLVHFHFYYYDFIFIICGLNNMSSLNYLFLMFYNFFVFFFIF